MKTALLIGLLATGAAQASSFTWYASPVKLYQCTGYAASSCTGFETSDSTQWIDSVGLKVTSTNPLAFQVSIMIHSQVYKAFNVPPDMSSPFVVSATDGSGATATVTIAYVKTRHCVKACVDRYLPEAGTAAIP